MTVAEFAEKNGFKAMSLPDGGRKIEGCYVGDLLSWVMGRAQEGQAWITIMSNQNVLAVASLVDVSCVVLAEGVELPEDIVAGAASKGVNILSSPLPAYETATLLAKESAE